MNTGKATMAILIGILMGLAIQTCQAQTFTIGVTIRSIHFKKKNKLTNEKYNNWNPGITIGYVNKNNIKVETGVAFNSHRKMAWYNTVGYWDGTYGAEIGFATGYKEQTGMAITPGYFLSYEKFGIRAKGNHEVVNFGFNTKLKEIQTRWDAFTL